MNSGAEAVETVIKTARKWGYQVKGVPENQAEVIKENNVDFIVVGTDWMKEGILQQLCITEDFLHTNNINMLFIPRYKSISSNEIKTRVINNV